VDWLKKVRLQDGRWARFYELSTDRPLFVDSKNVVSYSDTDLLDHYTLKDYFGIPSLLDRVSPNTAGEPNKDEPYWPNAFVQLSDTDLENQVRTYINELDKEGRWIDKDWIKSQTFVDGIFALSYYISKRQGEVKQTP
jgi:hypothetical protein